MKEIILTKEFWITTSSILIIVLRIVPTKKNKDILTAICRILEIILPNRKKGGGQL